MRKLRGVFRHQTLRPGKLRALRVYPYFNVWQKSHGFGREMELAPGVSTYCSSEICIIDYFLIAPNCPLMLYLQRSQINVPRDRRWETLPAPQVAAEGLTEDTKRGVFEKLGVASRCLNFSGRNRLVRSYSSLGEFIPKKERYQA
jgi:hypothetical protein